MFYAMQDDNEMGGQSGNRKMVRGFRQKRSALPLADCLVLPLVRYRSASASLRENDAGLRFLGEQSLA